MIWTIIFTLLLLWISYNKIKGRPIWKKKIITSGNDETYLIRYSLPWLTCKWFAVKMHNILLSDDACLHDHPWSFISVILRGGYLEHRTIDRPSAMFDICGVGPETISFKIAKYYRAGYILWRPKNTIHRLQLLEIDGKIQTAWTLVITFRKVKEWGFFTPKGFVNWREYNDDGGCEA